MNINGAISYFNRGKLSELIKFADVSDEKFKKRCMSVYKLKDTKNIYIRGTDLLSVFYWDEQKDILFTVNPFSYPEESLKYFEKIYEDKSWETLYYAIPQIFHLEMLPRIIKRVPDEDKYDIFMLFYLHNDYGFDELDVEFVKSILKLKPQKYKEKIEKAIINLPNKVTIYRGEGSKSNYARNSFSWTLDESIAYFFGCRYSDGAWINKAIIDKDNIIEYIDDEKEVIVNPDDILDIEDDYIYDVQTVVEKYINKNIFILNKYKSLMNTTQEFNKYIRCKHKNRVLSYAIALIGLYDLKLSKEDIEAICMALLIYDSTDIEKHFGRDIYDNINTNLMKILIEAIKTSKINEDSSKLCMLSSICLDAIRLDDVAKGIKNLDFKALKCDLSKKLLCFAVMYQHTELL